MAVMLYGWEVVYPALTIQPICSLYHKCNSQYCTAQLVSMLCVADMYVKDIETKTTVSDVEPKILRETAATAHVDGMNTLGPVVGNFCMQIAIAKAKEVGIGFVVAKGSSA